MANASPDRAPGPGYNYAPATTAPPPLRRSRAGTTITVSPMSRTWCRATPADKPIAEALPQWGGPRSLCCLGESALAQRRQSRSVGEQPTRRRRPGPRRARSRVSSAHSGSAGGPMCPQPRGQSLIASARSENANITSSGSMWASPNERMPGVSITQPPKLSGSATDCVEYAVPCRCRSPRRSPDPLRHKAIHQRGLADPGMAEQHGDLVGQQRGHDVEWVVAARGGDR